MSRDAHRLQSFVASRLSACEKWPVSTRLHERRLCAALDGANLPRPDEPRRDPEARALGRKRRRGPLTAREPARLKELAHLADNVSKTKGSGQANPIAPRLRIRGCRGTTVLFGALIRH